MVSQISFFGKFLGQEESVIAQTNSLYYNWKIYSPEMILHLLGTIGGIQMKCVRVFYIIKEETTTYSSSLFY